MSQQINFYDPALRLRRNWLTLDVLAAVSLALAGLLASATWALNVQVAKLEARAAALSTQLESARQTQDRLTHQRAAADQATRTRIAATRQAIEARSHVLEQLGQGEGADRPAGYAAVMQALSRQHRSGLWLTGFSLETGMQRIELRGRALDADLVPQYIQRLRRETALTGYRFDDLQLMQPPGEPAAGVQNAVVERPYLEFILTNRPASEQMAAAAGGGRT